jgi:hypothetical protein
MGEVFLYDAATKTILMFGGDTSGGSGALNDTWFLTVAP